MPRRKTPSYIELWDPKVARVERDRQIWKDPVFAKTLLPLHMQTATTAVREAAVIYRGLCLIRTFWSTFTLATGLDFTQRLPLSQVRPVIHAFIDYQLLRYSACFGKEPTASEDADVLRRLIEIRGFFIKFLMPLETSSTQMSIFEQVTAPYGFNYNFGRQVTPGSASESSSGMDVDTDWETDTDSDGSWYEDEDEDEEGDPATNGGMDIDSDESDMECGSASDASDSVGGDVDLLKMHANFRNLFCRLLDAVKAVRDDGVKLRRLPPAVFTSNIWRKKLKESGFGRTLYDFCQDGNLIEFKYN
uniref:Uncharacterized protein n=1 Tax=Mycena chlorophos TaxID=658473 RepID=A0ABQ0L275_MYCCL|nr:predicted protein [Mycena chlorophos]